MTLHPLLPLPVVAVLAALAVAAVGVRLARGPHRWLWAARAAAVLAAFGILLGPVEAAFTATDEGVAADVFFVVDRTGSMAAEDWGDGAPRLDGVRADVVALTEALPGARYSVLSWDSAATRALPLTTDARAVGSWAQTMRQEITEWSTGSTIDRPLDALRSALERSAEQEPDNARLVFLLSDGERTVDDERRSFAELADLVDGGAVLGYGTSQGGPMRSYDGSTEPDPEAKYIVDPDDPSQPAVSRIDEDELRGVAGELGVAYLHRPGPADGGSDARELAELMEDVDVADVMREAEREQTTWSPVVWPFAAAAAVALLVEVVVSVRQVARGRRPARGADLGERGGR